MLWGPRCLKQPVIGDRADDKLNRPWDLASIIWCTNKANVTYKVNACFFFSLKKTKVSHGSMTFSVSLKYITTLEKGKLVICFLTWWIMSDQYESAHSQMSNDLMMVWPRMVLVFLLVTEWGDELDCNEVWLWVCVSCLLNCWNALSLSGSDSPPYTSQWRKAEGSEATIVMM